MAMISGSSEAPGSDAVSAGLSGLAMAIALARFGFLGGGHGEAARFLSACREQFDLVLLDPPFHNGTLENILPAVEKCVAPGGIVLCESETGIVLPAQAGSLTLQKQYKYGKVLLWKYTKPMQPAAEQEGEAL